MADAIYLTLLFVHVFSAVAWLGAALLTNLLISPVLTRLSPQGRSELGKTLTPWMFRYILGSGIMTVLSGALLYFYLDFAPGSLGLAFIQAGALIAILVLTVATALSRRTAGRVGRLSEQLTKMSQGPQGDPRMAADLRSSIARLQSRLRATGLVSLVLLVVVLALMIVGRSI